MGLKGSVRLPSQRQWDGGRWEEGRMADRGALLERVKGGWSLQVGTGTPVHVSDCEAEGSEAGRGASLSAWERWGEGQQQI